MIVFVCIYDIIVYVLTYGYIYKKDLHEYMFTY